MGTSFEDEYCDDEIIQDSPKKRKFLHIFLSVTLALSGGLVFKSTFAANVTLGSGVLEFGQGIQVHTACAGNTPLTLKTQTAFANATGASGKFQLTGITLSGIPTTCYGKSIDIKAYAETATAPLALFNTNVDRVSVYNGNGTFWVTNAGSGYDITTNSNSSFTVTFTSPVSTSGSLTKFTVESMANTATLNCLQAGNCVVGSTNAPGGGIVFYVSSTPFTSVGSACNTNCRYLAMAPDGWAGTANDPILAITQNTSTLIGTTGGGVGNGLANTIAFSQLPNGGTSSNNAALRALAYAGTDGSAGQWYVPSIGELDLLINSNINSPFLGTLNVNWYGSSTEISASLYWTQLVQSPGKPTTQTGRADGRSTRIIRAF
jgi:hypothetical protein